MNVLQRYKEDKNPFALISCLFFVLAAFAFTGCTWGGDTGNMSISISIPELHQPTSKAAPLHKAITSLTLTAYIVGEEDNRKEVTVGSGANAEIDLGIVPVGPATVVIEAIGIAPQVEFGTPPTFFPYYGSTKTVVRPGVNVVNVYMDKGCLVTYQTPKPYLKTKDDGNLELGSFDLPTGTNINDDAIASRGLVDTKFVIPLEGKIPAFRMSMLNQRGDERTVCNDYCRFMGYAIEEQITTDRQKVWIENFTAPTSDSDIENIVGMQLYGVWYNYNGWMSFSDNEGSYDYYEVSQKYGVNDYTDKLFIPESYKGKQVKIINSNVFKGKTQLKEVNIPASITSILEHAFSGCEKLERINFAPDGKLATISEGAFQSCEGLTSVTIPASVTRIGKEAFLYCHNLASLEFVKPNGWYSTSSYTNWLKDHGDYCDVSNPVTNADYFKLADGTPNNSHYWFKK